MLIAGGIGSLGQLQQGAVNSLNSPRSLGLIEQAEGLESGLDDLERKLGILVSRISGEPQEASVTRAVAESDSLIPRLSSAASRLRSCMSLVEELHNRF